MHCEELLNQYHENLPTMKKLQDVVEKIVKAEIKKSGIFINSFSTRIKTENSLKGKLELKGQKYKKITDLTDILGARVVTYYSSDVDKIASRMERVFTVDRENSIDKRKAHNIDQFGYMSLHYICYLPKSLYSDPEYPLINEIPFELQMRTALQDVWATIAHDTGYKSDIEIPRQQLRNINRLAGLLELADEEFSNIKDSIESYRRGVKQIVADGNFDDVDLDIDSFNEYIDVGAFDRLNKRIADINGMDIQKVSLTPYYQVLRRLNFHTLGDVENFRKDNEEDAYQFALRLFSDVDLDIVASSIGIQCLSIVYLLKHSLGEVGIPMLLNSVNGERASNQRTAARYLKIGKDMGLVK